MSDIDTRTNLVDEDTRSFERENYYIKPKGLIGRLLQSLFYKLFPKKSLYFKDKIRSIADRVGFSFRFYLAIIFLRFRYPLYFRLPSKQLYALDIAINFFEILRPQNIDFFLLEGSLLGAIRQRSFAGRPKDIDLGIREEHLQKLLDAFPLLINNKARTMRGVKVTKDKSNKNIVKIQIMFQCTFIDIAIFRKKIVEGKQVWIGGVYPEELTKSRNVDKQTKGIIFPIEDLEHLITVEAYGRKFLSPANPEIYLKKIFGKDWKVPNKKQFFWEKNKFI